MHPRRTPRVALALLLLALPACARPRPTDPRIVTVWMQTLYGVIRVERLSPPVASRLVTYAASALYAGLSTTGTGMAPLTTALNGFPDLRAIPRSTGAREHPALTAIAAERVVLDSLLREGLPTTRASLTRLADSLDLAESQVDGETRAASRTLGTRLGLAIVAWARQDGFDRTRGRKWVPPTGPGMWANDAPANTYAVQNQSGGSAFVALDNPADQMRSGNTSDRSLILNRPKQAGVTTLPAMNISGISEPYWGEIRPFVLADPKECRVPGPPAFSTDTTARAYRDAYAVHSMWKRLTPEQRAIAYYWADNAGETGTPVGHWISIMGQMVQQRQLDAPRAAQLAVEVSAAMADAFIAAWGYKYQYNFVRPRAFVRAAIDSTWEPLIPTPPFPEYPSGHSTQSAAAAAVLTAALGDEPFEDRTGVAIGNAMRRFPSFTAAAEEAGISRVYAGLHFPSANLDGRALGQCIGRRVVERFATAATR